jgi:putative nucleotidyltransferase with HDIG domain
MASMATLYVPPPVLPKDTPVPLSAVVAQRIANNSLDLPLLPDIAAQVARVAADDGIDARGLLHWVRRDATLVANIMRVANTSLYAARVPLTTLQQAVSRLGFVQVRQLALAHACQVRIFKSARFENEVRESFHHSFATACYAELVARRRRAPAEEAFLLGLLHDVGEPVLLQEIHDIEVAQRASFDLPTALAIVEANHARVAAMMLQKWKLPPRMTDIVRGHHATPPDGATLAHILQLADTLSQLALGRLGDPELVRAHDSVRALSLYAEEVEQLIHHGAAVKELTEALP